MNIEELEQSLKTEFESYLKNTFADIRQEVTEFQKKIEAEFEKHKSQIDTAFDDFFSRFADDQRIDEAFKETVIEHLRLARDEGARITATAIAEAEKMEKEKATKAMASTQLSDISNAVKEISSKTTQSTILKSLVSNASKFTPRGAFFIIKNEHLVGWRVFGKEGNVDDKIVREVFFPVGTKTILSQATRDLKTVEGSYGEFSDDSIYLNRLQFGHPERMYAIPLIVRGRAVAVLYADSGNEGNDVCVEALETLVKVASLTVEISASVRSAKTHTDFESQTEESEQAFKEKSERPDFERDLPEHMNKVLTRNVTEETFSAYQFSQAEKFQPESYSTEITEESPTIKTFSPVIKEEKATFTSDYETKAFASEEQRKEVNVSEEYSFENSGSDISTQTEKTFQSEPAWNQPSETKIPYPQESANSFEIIYETSETPVFEAVEEPSIAQEDFSATTVGEYKIESIQPSGTSQPEFEQKSSFGTPSFETTVFEAKEVSVTNGKSFETVTAEVVKTETSEPEKTQPIVESVATPPAKSRLSERNIDLPIEVPEDERRFHNDARRFARLLVSEIKLYNKQKVKEGREANDLYERLREAIDRSREMYEKRVHPPVAAKFDYFHYELVSNLAEGDPSKLGDSYPGASV